jgi:molybdate transport system permease protein
MNHRRIDRTTGTIAIISSLLIILPVVALLAKVPWSSLSHRLDQPDSISAIRLSLWTSSLSAVLAVFFGIPLAWFLARSSDRVTNILRPLVLAPIVLPPTVAGMALLALLGRDGFLGRYIYQATGWAMPFTSVAVVFVGIFVGMPFFVLVAESTFRRLPSDVEDAAVTDRATPGKLLVSIALPQARGGIATGAVLAWARALGEFGATMMFAGSLPGLTQTWPMQVYVSMDVDMDTAYALSAIMVAVAVVVVFALRKQLRQAFR